LSRHKWGSGVLSGEKQVSSLAPVHSCEQGIGVSLQRYQGKCICDMSTEADNGSASGMDPVDGLSPDFGIRYVMG